jgi:hypothetical protein
MQLQLLALKVSREHKGITTASQWVASLRTEGLLAANSQSLDTFLESVRVHWWPASNVSPFPEVGAMESSSCQPYVTARINEIHRGQVHRKKALRFPGTPAYLDRSDPAELRSIPVDGHSIVSYGGRSPDVPCYYGTRRGACSITLLGDVKGCGARSKDFPEAEVGHILDMGTDLMTKQQFTRATLFCFLTDGYRFQFFRCVRTQQGDQIMYEQSAVYGGEHGWQVRYSLPI